LPTSQYNSGQAVLRASGNTVLFSLAIIAASLATGLWLFLAPVTSSRTWHAMITPLASIIGSGFLVLGPVLNMSYGDYSPLAMAALCAGAYLFGSAVRFNIAALADSSAKRSHQEEALETAASWSLAFAYVISVAYYLNLFGSFGVNLTGARDPIWAKLLTSATFLLILATGWLRGFEWLEKLEYVSVAIKLSIIAGLLVGLLAYFFEQFQHHALVFNHPQKTGWAAVTLAFGLLVTVQGFETSRYLGDEYDVRTRIRSMKLAQWISSAIYMAYIALIAYVFSDFSDKPNETAIIDMMRIVAPILPFLLVAAALSAQFSAAVADTGGSGGLIAELTGNRLSTRHGYALLVAAGLLLTWSSNIFQIISYASRAFALYYCLQALIAAKAAMRLQRRSRAAIYLSLAFVGVLIVIFGEAVDV
jgi:hypothetical protein